MKPCFVSFRNASLFLIETSKRRLRRSRPAQRVATPTVTATHTHITVCAHLVSADPHAAEDFSFRARRSHVQPNVRAARSSRNACPRRAGQYRRPASLRAFVTGPQVQSFVLFPFSALCTLRCIRTDNCRSIRDHQTCCASARVPGAEHVARRLSGSLETGPLSMAPNLRYALRT